MGPLQGWTAEGRVAGEVLGGLFVSPEAGGGNGAIQIPGLSSWCRLLCFPRGPGGKRLLGLCGKDESRCPPLPSLPAILGHQPLSSFRLAFGGSSASFRSDKRPTNKSG